MTSANGFAYGYNALSQRAFKPDLVIDGGITDLGSCPDGQTCPPPPGDDPASSSQIASESVRVIYEQVGWILFHYDEAGRLIGEYDEQGDAIRQYVWLDDMPVAVIDDDGIAYVHADHLNTPRKLTDILGLVTWNSASRPFGDDAVPLGRMPLRFPGQYHDSETGLNQNWHRNYMPNTGRFAIPDPLGLSDGPNPYAYVHGNPMTLFDPLGLSSCGAAGGRVFPSEFGVWSFEASCKAHDGCYATCGANKRGCDRKFLGDMGKECRTKISAALGALLNRCLQKALLYFQGVANYGGDAYNAAQRIMQLRAVINAIYAIFASYGFTYGLFYLAYGGWSPVNWLHTLFAWSTVILLFPYIALRDRVHSNVLLCVVVLGVAVTYAGASVWMLRDAIQDDGSVAGSRWVFLVTTALFGCGVVAEMLISLLFRQKAFRHRRRA